MVSRNSFHIDFLHNKFVVFVLALVAVLATLATTSFPRTPLATSAALHVSADPIVTSAACVLEDDGAKSPSVDPTLVVRASNYLFDLGSVEHWNKAVVRMRLDGGDGRRSEEETRRALGRAAALWNDQLGAVVSYEWTTDANADVTIHFAPASTLPARAVGKTDTRFRSLSHTLVHADIILAEGLKEDRLVQVAAHEMGHALGVSGHSPASDDLMFPITHTPARITDRDRNTMCLNYQTVSHAPATISIPSAQSH